MLLFLGEPGVQKSAVADGEVDLQVPLEGFLQQYLRCFFLAELFEHKLGLSKNVLPTKAGRHMEVVALLALEQYGEKILVTLIPKNVSDCASMRPF
jgi:hypothetical protein